VGYEESPGDHPYIYQKSYNIRFIGSLTYLNSTFSINIRPKPPHTCHNNYIGGKKIRKWKIRWSKESVFGFS
jgi:hypothetical protein